MANRLRFFSLLGIIIWTAGCGFADTNSTDGNRSSLSSRTSEQTASEDTSKQQETVVSIELFPPEILMKPESKVRFSVVAKDKDGNLVNLDNNNLSWESSDPLLSPIDTTGIITGVVEGTSEIRVTSGELISQPAKVVTNNVVPKPYPIDKVFPAEDSLQEASYSSGLRVHFSKDSSGNYDVEWTSIRFFLNGMEFTSKTILPSCEGQPCGWVYFESEDFFAPGNYTGEIRLNTLSGESKDYVWRFRLYWDYQEDRPQQLRVWPPKDSRPFSLDAITVFFDLYLDSCSKKISGSWQPDDWYVSHQLYVDGEPVDSPINANGCAIISLDDTATTPSTTATQEVVRGYIVYTPNPALIIGRHDVMIEIHTYRGQLIQYQWEFEAP